jgi:uncharacterized protein YdaL
LLTEESHDGVRLITHGTTHQLDNQKNPSGIISNDFEFWDTVHDKPVPLDSPKWVLTRLNEGWTSISKAKLKTTIWEAPHYHASPLDYILFSRVFPRSIGRMVYQSVDVSGLPDASLDLNFSSQKPLSLKEKIAAFSKLKVTLKNPAEGGQFFPYEIDRDYFGQNVIPEDLGNPALAGERPKTLADIRADAKRDRVIRDAWASFFFHGFLLGKTVSEDELRLTFREFKKLGYEFVDLETFH